MTIDTSPDAARVATYFASIRSRQHPDRDTPKWPP
jgi:hypothetical protein